MNAGPVVFNIAIAEDELAQIHRLNYRTFVEEIPQHDANRDGELVDRFDHENTYVVAKQGARVVGMITVRDRRPFSLDEKLPGLDEFLPPGREVCEIRLLAVEPEFRNGVVFHGLMREVARFCIGLGFDTAVISGTTRQLRLYRHIGFVPFGPRVGTPGAEYQPMYLTLDAYRETTDPIAGRNGHSAIPVSFLPGPVDLHPDVRRAYQSVPISHRGDAFVAELQAAKRLLSSLTGAPHVEVMVGSGTLANDAVALQIATRGEPGVVLVNGEFGERLMDHARRAGLRFAPETLSWGEAFDAAAIDRVAARHQDARWLWMVHHETSTGVLNDLGHAVRVCGPRGVRVCADCVSSIGVVPVDLRGVYLATCVSGKALGGVAGLGLVFHHGDLAATPGAPRYLDLSLYAEATGGGVPFTQPSGLVAALRAATALAIGRGDLSDIRERAAWLRRELAGLGLRVLAPERVASPGIVTLPMDAPGEAERIGDALARVGLEASYRSSYLRERNWLQLSLMGECSRHKLELLIRVLRRVRSPRVGRLAPSLTSTAAAPVS